MYKDINVFEPKSSSLEDSEKKITLLTEKVRLQNSMIESYREKEKRISKALIDAMSRARNIEENSRKIYDLEIARLRDLYNKFKAILESLTDSNINPEIVEAIEHHKKTLKASINKALVTQNERLNVTHKADQRMRELLSKMNDEVDNKKQTNKELVENGENKELKLKPILNVSNYNKNDNVDMVDKFLEDETIEENAYADELLHKEKDSSNGFDLKEAVNPTESLEEIMKSFNLDD